MALLLLFIDGLGLAGREGNPLFDAGARVLALDSDAEKNYSYRGGVAKSADATMGLGGLPQSATGQTAIFTGVNTARLVGRHLSGWPNALLRQLLRQETIFSRMQASGLRACFANAFTPAYFLRPIGRMSASTLHMLYAGLRPRWIWQIPEGKAVFQDFTNQTLISAGFDLPLHTPEQAGANLASLLGCFDFILYEFFITDAAAHGRVKVGRARVISLLDRMIDALLEAADLDAHCVALCSDHGNIEDPTTRSHTRNPVPLVAWGKGRGELFEDVDSIDGIAQAVCAFMNA